MWPVPVWDWDGANQHPYLRTFRSTREMVGIYGDALELASFRYESVPDWD